MAFGLVWPPFLDVMYLHGVAQKGAESSLLKPTIAPLRKRSDFLALRTSGHSWYCNVFKVRYGCPSPLREVCTSTTSASGSLRVAFVISKRVSKKAVIRNRIRRRLREALRATLQGSSPPGRHDFTITPRLECKDAPFHHLVTHFKHALKHIERKNTSHPKSVQDQLSRTC
jgi:ribonuclease P protein component